MNQNKNRARFIAGITLITASLILGKLVFIPLLFYPANAVWKVSMIIAYGITWIMLLIGVWFAGKEGYHLVMNRYEDQKRKTVHAVKHHVRTHAGKMKHHATSMTNKTKNLVRTVGLRKAKMEGKGTETNKQ